MAAYDWGRKTVRKPREPLNRKALSRKPPRLSTPHRALVSAVRRSWRLYDAISFRVEVLTVDGSLRVPIRNRIGLNNVDFIERPIIAAIRALYRYRSGTFVDIGANIGKILLNLLYVDRTIPYLGFEPNLACSAYVEELIAANGLTRHTIVPIGLSDKPGVAKLMMSHAWDVSASTVPHFRGSGTYAIEKPVHLGVGDQLLPDLCDGPIACIKIDVEGAEAEVLAGLSETIAAHRPVLVIEVLPYDHIERGDYSRTYFGEIPPEEIEQIVAVRKETARRIEQFLDTRRYGLALMREDGSFLPVRSFDQDGRRNFKEINFLAVPQEEMARFCP